MKTALAEPIAMALSVVDPPEQIPSPVVPYVEANPSSVLLKPDLRKRFLAEIQEEIDASKPDLTTKKGREAIASLAYKIARTKAPIEAAAKALTEDYRKRTAAVNAEKKDVLEKLDTLRDTARKPLDDWEEAEKQREAEIKQCLDFLDTARTILATDTSAGLKERLALVEAVEGDEFADAKAFAIKSLMAGIERLEKEEADRAELARLRAEQAERDRLEAERQAAHIEYCRDIIQHIHDCGNGIIGGKTYPYAILFRELEEKIVIDESFGDLAEYAERARATAIAKLTAGQKADLERSEAAAKRAAEEAVAAERRKAEEALAAERRAADEAARKEREAHDAELARIAAEKRKLEEAEAARVAEEKRLADEQAARERDKKHRGEIMGAAKVALIAAGGLTEEQAKAIVLAIVIGKIPNVSIKF